MRLKRLEIQGFKSFAHRVCLEFGPGITAIVGPNGSGKSNISDALRWVMGEQSIKSLRGSKLEDIIFAGSDGKKPLGMAEVQLTLDNSEGFLPVDYSEVTITRRVYRSGDSDFFINKQSCRLKDIQDLLTDTGLGRESYAVIGQGQIDAVLSVRSEDRRVLLEETAGIVKYRQRKEQALRKLEATSVDLLRVTDVLHELEGRLGPLGEQAEKARRYLELAEHLKGAELDYYHLLWSKLEDKLAQRGENYQTLQVEYEEGEERLQRLEAQTAELEAQERQLGAELGAKQEQLTALADAQRQGRHSIELYRERIQNQEARSRQLTHLIQEKEQELELLAREEAELGQGLDSLRRQIESQETAASQAQRGLEELQAKQRQTQARINELKDEFFEFMRELAEGRNFQRSFSERQSSLEAQIESGSQEAAALGQRLAELEAAAARKEARLAELGRLLAAQEEQEQALTAELAAVKAAHQGQQNKVRQLEGEQARVLARLRTLQELEEGYEGYNQGVRRVMQNGDTAKLVLGTVADVVKVPSGLETAFEVAFGSSLQNLITATEQDAKSIIAWLQKVQGGRVTILPLDTVRGWEFSPQAKKALEQPGVLGAALDLLEFAPQYRPALASLLGRVAITEDLDTALRLRRTLKQFSRLVTKDGSVVAPSGAMTGGSLNNRTWGLLARKGELSSLQEKLELLAQELEAAKEQEQELLQAISRLEDASVKLQEEQLQTRLAQQEAAQALQQAREDGQRLRTSCAQLEERIADLRNILANLGSQAEQAAAKVAELEAEEQARRSEIQREETALSELATAVEEVGAARTQEQVRLAELKGSLENQRIQLANLVQQKKQAQNLLEQSHRELEELAEGRVANEEAIRRTELALEEQRQHQAELEEALARQKDELGRVQEERSRLGAELVQKQKEQLSKERALYRLEVELSQLEAEQEQIKEALAERELTLASIVNREVERSETALKRDIEVLRGEIRDLGLVNPAANEEYEQVLERCAFLRTQLADLDEARESLQDVINEMDKLCRTKLKEVFEQVRVEFQKLFKRLFVGGTADLVLTDPDSILTTGIDVLAKPPGKKLQNLLLLSGGERALTAIALLFAIRRVKPTPFWVLDEIDAALDESNLERFTELMMEFSQDTQFLVVTHRPTTMEAAHTLYGVTMGDEGVSQIISVELT